MTMRAPVTDLPIVLEDVSVVAGGVTIVDRISLELAAGSPTVLIGPNGAGRPPSSVSSWAWWRLRTDR